MLGCFPCAFGGCRGPLRDRVGKSPGNTQELSEKSNSREKSKEKKSKEKKSKEKKRKRKRESEKRDKEREKKLKRPKKGGKKKPKSRAPGSSSVLEKLPAGFTGSTGMALGSSDQKKSAKPRMGDPIFLMGDPLVDTI